MKDNFVSAVVATVDGTYTKIQLRLEDVLAAAKCLNAINDLSPMLLSEGGLDLMQNLLDLQREVEGILSGVALARLLDPNGEQPVGHTWTSSEFLSVIAKFGEDLNN